ncbi:hypothetical protein L211DRAFT_841759 [Terfezia boudieri ATCC MYA-4762]|uniref:Uncharacterized protein n=1 Tax=Terfezia boudieri ATCC MYA-4762 TaxID=1051890 RepID=A0A3N4LFV0_9PEZI|nr:hypothetical protein L211DRAFT_841759 [Terfezia boudieri ATCC MYA-4762]
MRVTLPNSSDIGNGLPSANTQRTPDWSKTEPWAQDLDNINIGCVQDLNEAFEDCQDDLQSDNWERTPLDILELRLDETFELLRTKANKAIDESKAKAKQCLAGKSVEAQKEAVGRFVSGMQCVMEFICFLRNSITQIVTMIKNSARSAWRAILSPLRRLVATKAMVAASRIRKLPPGSNSAGIRLEAI